MLHSCVLCRYSLSACFCVVVILLYATSGVHALLAAPMLYLKQPEVVQDPSRACLHNVEMRQLQQ